MGADPRSRLLEPLTDSQKKVRLPYSAEHRVLGNGVVPQQAVAALWRLVAMAVGQQAEGDTIHERGMAA